MIPPPLYVDGPGPGMLPAFPLPRRARELRPLYVLQQEVRIRTAYGWVRIPRGYVTDFGSIPPLATWATFSALRPLGSHAWAALAHDFGYAIGEPGMKPAFDRIFLDQMKLDGVSALKRGIMYQAVRLAGGEAYAGAPSWWETENFADPVTGAYPVAPWFPREAAFTGGLWGMRPDPDWPELLAA